MIMTTARDFDGVKTVTTEPDNNPLTKVGDLFDLVSSSDTNSRLLVIRNGLVVFAMNMVLNANDHLVALFPGTNTYLVIELNPNALGELLYGETAGVALMKDNGGSTG